MRIGIDATFISGEFDGGKDQFLFNLLEGFEKNNKGKDFVIFCKSEVKEKIKKIIPSAEIFVVIPKQYINWLFIKLKIIKKPIFDEIILRSFFYRDIKKKYKINILFFPKPMTGFLKIDTKTIVIPHDIQILSHKERFSLKTRMFNNIFYKLDFKLRDIIISISDFDKEEILDKFPKLKNKVIKIYNPIKVNQNIEINQDKKPYIIAINLAYEHKNIITLLKAFNLIKDKIQYNLLLVGKINSYGEFLKKYVIDNKLEERVIFTGYIEEKELYLLLKNSSLYVNPSIFEGFGMTAAEAMILEVPTLVAANTAMPEITKNLCFYYKNVYDEKELADKILEIFSLNINKEKLRKISEVIFDEYNYIKISKEYYELFAKLGEIK